jgi:CO/xanthine dehydrogenase FAD-binding subunit
MLLPKFEYFAPKTIEEACSLLAKYKGEARVLAGGTDLLVQMKNREVTPRYLINIKDIPDLDYIRYDDKEGLRIGALTPIEALKTSTLIRRRFGILSQAAAVLGTVQIRNRGTIAGNLCNASPAAETAPALITLAAKARIVGVAGERAVALEDFFVGPGQTVLQTGEIVTEIQVPNVPPRSGGAYLKHSIKRMDIAIVGVGVVITLNGEVCNDIKIALGAVASTPIRAKKAEEIIRGQGLDSELMERAAQTASEESRPIDDIHSYAQYRKQMVKVLAKEAMKQAGDEAKSGGS